MIYNVILVWGTRQSNPLRTHVSCTDRQTTEPPGKPTQFFFFFFNFVWMAWPHRSGYLHFENSRHGAFMKTQQIWQNWVHIPTWRWAEASSLRLYSLVSLVPPQEVTWAWGPCNWRQVSLLQSSTMAKTGAQRKSKWMPKGLQEVSVLMNLEPSLFRQLTLPRILAGLPQTVFNWTWAMSQYFPEH